MQDYISQASQRRSPEENLYRYLERHDMVLILNQICEIIRQRYPDHWKTRISFVLMGISGAAADLEAYLSPTPEDPFFFLNDEDLEDCA